MSFLNDMATKIKTWANGKFESNLGNPSEDGQVLMSSASGVRSWGNAGGSGETIIALTTMFSVTGTTQVDIPNWSFSVESGKTYIMEYTIPFGTIQTPNFNFYFPLGSTGTIHATGLDYSLSVQSYVFNYGERLITTDSTTTNYTISKNITSVLNATNLNYIERGVIILQPTTNGTFNIKLKSAGTGQTVQMLAGSNLKINVI